MDREIRAALIKRNTGECLSRTILHLLNYYHKAVSSDLHLERSRCSGIRDWILNAVPGRSKRSHIFGYKQAYINFNPRGGRGAEGLGSLGS